jgi:hypothetical protein
VILFSFLVPKLLPACSKQGSGTQQRNQLL